MGKVNICLYRSYITVVSFIAIISVILLSVLLFVHGFLIETEEFSPQMRAGFFILYVISIVPLLLAIFGLVGVCQKKMWALILFTVGMMLISLLMSVSEVAALVYHSEMAGDIEDEHLAMGPLVNTSDSFQDIYKEAQTEYQCCGMDQGYVDWGYNIPESCLCTDQSMKPCVAAPPDSILFDYRTNDQPIMVYEEPCLPYLVAEELNLIFIVSSVLIAFTLIWVLSIVLCIFILCRMNRREDTTVMFYTPEVNY
ncbi:tetraspanin-8-like isoform X1 [Paralichthys olivaceus]|uniref:tetraspanin-8-like isoform X1 n=2 Tax=Paralichthys olivaceus TaxID=8255 RepID=UPI0037516BE1